MRQEGTVLRRAQHEREGGENGFLQILVSAPNTAPPELVEGPLFLKRNGTSCRHQFSTDQFAEQPVQQSHTGLGHSKAFRVLPYQVLA